MKILIFIWSSCYLCHYNSLPTSLASSAYSETQLGLMLLPWKPKLSLARYKLLRVRARVRVRVEFDGYIKVLAGWLPTWVRCNAITRIDFVIKIDFHQVLLLLLPDRKRFEFRNQYEHTHTRTHTHVHMSKPIQAHTRWLANTHDALTHTHTSWPTISFCALLLFCGIFD